MLFGSSVHVDPHTAFTADRTPPPQPLTKSRPWCGVSCDDAYRADVAAHIDLHRAVTAKRATVATATEDAGGLSAGVIPSQCCCDTIACVPRAFDSMTAMQQFPEGRDSRLWHTHRLSVCRTHPQVIS